MCAVRTRHRILLTAERTHWLSLFSQLHAQLEPLRSVPKQLHRFKNRILRVFQALVRASRSEIKDESAWCVGVFRNRWLQLFFVRPDTMEFSKSEIVVGKELGGAQTLCACLQST